MLLAVSPFCIGPIQRIQEFTMSISRRTFSSNALALAFASALFHADGLGMPRADVSSADAPHDAYEFWNGFFDSVNTSSADYHKGARAGTAGLADPTAETQYLHYKADAKQLRYATDIAQDELLNHDGDVSVAIQLSKFRPGSGTDKSKNQQLRIDATQTHAYMNLLAPLAWTAIASLKPSAAGKISLDQLGFKSDQAVSATSNILLTKGTGKLAVNVSQPPNDSQFVKILKIMITGAKLIAPMVVLPAVSVPALSAFSEAFAYWEDRTRFVMNGNLITAVATQQALSDPTRDDSYIGLLNGDYVMVAKKDTEQLGKEMPNLDLVQGYLVRKDAKQTDPLETRADAALPGVPYTTMKLAVKAIDPSCGNSGSKPVEPSATTSPAATPPKKKKP
jgi:hypothetical protein